MAKYDALLSLNAVCGVIDGYTNEESVFVNILKTLKNKNLIKNGYVYHSQLSKIIKEFV